MPSITGDRNLEKGKEESVNSRSTCTKILSFFFLNFSHHIQYFYVDSWSKSTFRIENVHSSRNNNNNKKKTGAVGGSHWDALL